MRERLGLAIVVFACYGGAALGVTNAYPFSTFPMYSEDSPTFGARLVVKDRGGERREVDRYEDWTCAADLSFDDLEQTVCPDGRIGQPTGYLVKEALDHIREHPDDDSRDAEESVDLVIRTWRLDGEQIVELDCPVARCRARLQ
ncbi:hypothetical protein [Enhygromyxa salina]|nr:hypothetical protein [Enhygromyxa salina]